ncbi:MAG TPA: universal stress protein [Polyangiaceae bacterium]|nr:universal stress protein [Polyangiaceae bacterium]
MSFQRILVPVDYSPHSELAVRTAASLAALYRASMTLVHVYLPPISALPGGFVFQSEPEVDWVFAKLGSYLGALAEKARAAGAANVATRIVMGAPATALCDLASDERFDLMVMGTHGRTGLNHALLGSVAERVARLAPCPVLTVRALQESESSAACARSAE